MTISLRERYIEPWKLVSPDDSVEASNDLAKAGFVEIDREKERDAPAHCFT
jgi:hypothetical protein